MQKLLLVYYYSENRAASRLESTSKYGFSPDFLGENGVLSMGMQVGWTLFSPARVQPLYGARRKESSGTGLTFHKHFGLILC